ncbi:hypothetical protein SEA_FIREBALL_11 [Gordonia phage Fireball]|uniref:Uncharacterized protein n=1 Tax=Gordonia phage Fireball TaxID=2652412 RepID=A0A5P8DA19_9CAUD|nr:hypothetical protein KNU74_gp11 [Gordonia phage Fireball]QFP95836.1 hypothetical protein SEA_FIREBALL_11 [Gordonia phage Fireball]
MTDRRETRPAWLCGPCASGNHNHDRLVPDGTDGGCSNALWENHTMLAACSCAVRLPPVATRRHCPTCRCGSPPG